MSEITWITPKTDWTKTTPVTYEDYNRILNNCMYLLDKYTEQYPDYPMPDGYFDFAGPKTGYGDSYFPHDFNYFEEVLEFLVSLTGTNKNVGDTKRYHDNDPFIDYNDLNRIEKSILAWYTYEDKDYDLISSPIKQTGRNSGAYLTNLKGVQGHYIALTGWNKCYIYDTVKNKWTEWDDIPSSQEAYDGCLVNTPSALYYIGGSLSNKKVYKCVPSSTNANSHKWSNWGNNYPQAISNCYKLGWYLFNKNNGRSSIYVFGGMLIGAERPNTYYVAPYGNNSWVKNTLPDSEMEVKSATYWNGRFYFLLSSHGGYKTTKVYRSNEVNAGDKITSITEFANKPSPYQQPDGVLLTCRENLYLIGGQRNTSSDDDGVKLWKFNGTSFVKVIDLPKLLCYMMNAIVCNDYIYIISGDLNAKNIYKVLKY